MSRSPAHTGEPTPGGDSAGYRLSWRDRLPGPLAWLVNLPFRGIAIAGIVSLVLADQIYQPNSRIIKLLAGVALVAVAIRTRPFYALCFIALFFLFPFSIFVGSSTTIFVVLVAIVYLARLTLRQADPLHRVPGDVGVGLLFAAYLLSFYNVDTSAALRNGLFNLIGVVTSFLLFFMTSNFIRTEEQLRTFVRVMLIGLAASIFVGMYELFFPGRTMIPHWILYRPGLDLEADYRVGGPLYDYELFAEYLAISFFLAFFWYRRAATPNQRFFGAVLTVMTVFALLTTVTRGATIAFLGGVVYLFWCIRRNLKFRDLVSTLLAGSFLYIILEFVVTNFTRSGSIADRLFKTKFEGITPDSRGHWPETLDRALDHPFLGHGPWFDTGSGGLEVYLWPHNQYLFYLHTVGMFGLFAFLLVVGRLVYLSAREKAPSLQETSYPRSLMTVLHVMLVVFLVDQLKIDHLRNDIYQFYPWILFGMIAATHRLVVAERLGGKGGG